MIEHEGGDEGEDEEEDLDIDLPPPPPKIQTYKRVLGGYFWSNMVKLI